AELTVLLPGARIAPISRIRAFFQTRLEKSGANGAKTRIISVGRVRILRSPLLAETGDESVPYPFRSQMAKVEPLGKGKETVAVLDGHGSPLRRGLRAL
ncbi:MAG: hypothetical protein M3P86_05725, partial [Actinomycetota bacterium]|nr:hypothetical protein [Actinomycetota bacterium]